MTYDSHFPSIAHSEIRNLPENCLLVRDMVAHCENVILRTSLADVGFGRKNPAVSYRHILQLTRVGGVPVHHVAFVFSGFNIKICDGRPRSLYQR